MDRITVNPNQCGGRPCIRGMRIRVKDVLDMLAEGATQEEILADFPDLEAADIRACIVYAAAEKRKAPVTVMHLRRRALHATRTSGQTPPRASSPDARTETPSGLAPLPAPRPRSGR